MGRAQDLWGREGWEGWQHCPRNVFPPAGPGADVHHCLPAGRLHVHGPVARPPMRGGRGLLWPESAMVPSGHLLRTLSLASVLESSSPSGNHGGRGYCSDGNWKAGRSWTHSRVSSRRRGLPKLPASMNPGLGDAAAEEIKLLRAKGCMCISVCICLSGHTGFYSCKHLRGPGLCAQEPGLAAVRLPASSEPGARLASQGSGAGKGSPSRLQQLGQVGLALVLVSNKS